MVIDWSVLNDHLDVVVPMFCTFYHTSCIISTHEDSNPHTWIWKWCATFRFMKLNGKIVSSAILGGYGLMFQIWLVLVIESTNSEVNTFKIMQYRSIHISCIHTLLCPNVLSYLSFVSKVIRKDSVENVKLLFILNCCCAAVANWCKLHMKPAAAGFLIYIWNGSPILEAELLLLRSGLSVLPPL